ncbi:asparaginase [Actinomyces gaoshouyii]|uniref:asparaginase n=1 Tax=Actinomyces gaoshouyii TaxID=1960083 RepID=A0A8H9LKR4_9ACTO|nr:asparaginase [Actinomyces gaoshouyii]ARD42411.1 L-asparaginase 1 [Actinomyces gaoshouyii]GGO95494.1 L-asparaginase 1 [Actinomyces gaoshouyii]
MGSVHIIYTGGTIGMVDSPQGLVPGADLAGWLAGLLPPSRPPAPGLEALESTSLAALEPLIDSSNATPESWQSIVEAVRAHAADHPGEPIVILHGTDTMAYTSAALSYALAGMEAPVVITGSQLPLGAEGSDAEANVLGAVRAAVSGRVIGVALFFGGLLLAGGRATKSSSWDFAGFASPMAPPLARTGSDGAPWEWSENHGASGASTSPTAWTEPRPYARHDVVVLDMAPGITGARLSALLDPLPEAVILRAFGVGNVPSDEPGLTEAIARAIRAGTAVFVASQCHQAEVLLGHYATGDAIARAGAVGTADMTLEAAYAKAQFLLAQGLAGTALAEAMGRPIAGELSPRR